MDYVIARPGAASHPRDPVAEGGPVGFSDGGNRRDWFPGGSGAEGGLPRLAESKKKRKGCSRQNGFD